MKDSKHSNQEGFVSIIVTLILMIVLTLIVLGFARLARREQRNALDRQLSTQAFYAAESGINDLVASYKSNPGNYFNSNPTNQTCAGTSGIPGLNTSVNPTYNVSYTCVLYDSGPPTLQYSATSNVPTVIPISNANLKTLKINWGKDTTDTLFRTTGPDALPKVGSWNSDPGVLRIMLIPRTSINRDDYLQGTFTGFLYPKGNGAATGTVAFGAGVGNSGILDAGSCNLGNNPYKCNMEITGISPANGWFIVLVSLYHDSKVEITCNDGAADVDCTGAQLVVDVTGKANDVTRRVQVRKPVLPTTDFLPIGFESVNSICKQLVISPPYLADAGGLDHPPCIAF